jgi:hypothetical protein
METRSARQGFDSTGCKVLEEVEGVEGVEGDCNCVTATSKA